jgi:hypothetical protein
MDLTVAGGMGGSEAMVKLLEIDPQVKGLYQADIQMTRYLPGTGNTAFAG